MKKTFAKIIVLTGVLGIALIPAAAGAVSYYPGYTCYYRDISGSCQNYQTSNPYFLGNRSALRSQSPYGNRRSLNSFNAYEVQPSPWDNRYSNREGWKYYYDEDDDRVRQYYLEPDRYYDYGNRYEDRYGRNYYGGASNYVEYEYTKYYCEGHHCDTPHY